MALAYRTPAKVQSHKIQRGAHDTANTFVPQWTLATKNSISHSTYEDSQFLFTGYRFRRKLDLANTWPKIMRRTIKEQYAMETHVNCLLPLRRHVFTFLSLVIFVCNAEGWRVDAFSFVS